MDQHHIRFIKTVCDDNGHQHRCVQGEIHVRRAKDQARALRAAKLKFQRAKRTEHWRTHADEIEIVH